MQSDTHPQNPIGFKSRVLPWLLAASTVSANAAVFAAEHPPGDRMRETGTTLAPPGSPMDDRGGLERRDGNADLTPRTDTRSRPEPYQGTTPHMNQSPSTREEPPRPDTTLDTEKMNRGPAPDTENMNKDTVSPGGDNMFRNAIPGGSGLNQ